MPRSPRRRCFADYAAQRDVDLCRASLSVLPLVRDYLRHARRHALACADVQELVWPVRIAVWAEDAGDEELRGGVALAEHSHERDRAAFAPCRRRLAKEHLRRAVDRLHEPRI